jgi:hypothetical protein
MGFLDRVLSGQGPDYKRPLLELEGVVGVWTAARTGLGGLSLAGGQVVLARDHLVFSPWDMDDTRAFLVKWLGKAGVPHLGTVDQLLTATKLLEPVVLPVADIAKVDVLSRGSLMKPPAVRIHVRSGGHLDIGILHSPTTPNVSSKNNAALEDFVSKVGVALA